MASIDRKAIEQTVRRLYAEVGLNAETYKADADLLVTGKIPDLLTHAYRQLDLVATTSKPIITNKLVTVGDLVEHLFQTATRSLTPEEVETAPPATTAVSLPPAEEAPSTPPVAPAPPRVIAHCLWYVGPCRVWFIPTAWWIGVDFNDGLWLVQLLPTLRVAWGPPNVLIEGH